MSGKNIKLATVGLIILTAIFCFGTMPAKAADFSAAQQTKITNVIIPWVENQGQIKDDSVKFSANIFMGTVFVTDNGTITYSLKQNKADQKGAVIKEIPQFKNTPLITGQEQTETKINYFIGADKSKWQTNVAAYNVVLFGEIYPNIELKLKAHGNNVEKLYTIYPNGDPSDIKMTIKGADKLSLTKDGQLQADVHGVKPIYFTKPIAYQDINGTRVNVSIQYKLNKNSYSFTVGAYNKNYNLVIDPELDTLLVSTYFGGSTDGESPLAMTADADGNLFILGNTYSTDFPTTTGAYDTELDTGPDIVIIKMDSDLSSLLAMTILGADGWDEAWNLGIDGSGNIFIAGDTDTTFPTTTGAYQTSTNGLGEGFVSKLDNDLTSLLASTYFGGSDNEYVTDIKLDSSGNVYIAGYTASNDIAITAGTYGVDYGGGAEDGFVVKFNNALTHATSTYIGATGDEWINALALDGSGNVYLAGNTTDSSFPTTTDAFDTTPNVGPGNNDGFVVKLNNDFSSLLSSTLLGGSDDDRIWAMTLSPTYDSLYVAGRTYSTDFATTSGAYDTTQNGDSDVFVTKFNIGLTQALASTYLGGSGEDRLSDPAEIYVDAYTVYLSGTTASTGFPTTTGAYQVTRAGGFDSFLTKMSLGLTALQGSTYFGGTLNEGNGGLYVNSERVVYLLGDTYSTNLPVTAGAYSTSNAGSYDMFIAKFGNPVPAITSLSPSRYRFDDTSPFTLTVNGTGFVVSSTIKINGVSFTTTYVTTTKLTSTVTAGDIGTHGTYDVTVYSSTPGGGTSASSIFTLYIQNGGGGYISTPAPIVVSAPSTPVVSPTTSTTTTTTVTTLAGCPALSAGDMVKVTGKAAIYSLNSNLQVLYFPSGDEFKSWNVDNSYGGYKSISQSCFDALSVPSTYPGAVNYRPGSYVVKKSSADQLYVVLPNNTLSKITDTDATALYGQNYTVKIISDPFWPHYINRGTDTTSSAHQGMLISKDTKTWYVDAGNVLREVTANGMTTNRFKTSFIHVVSESYLTGFTTGDLIDVEVPIIASRVQ
ncbi:MAG: SBBP repeat-containing protein [Patescibacteria group bacterium]